jgi:hypothetical protein
MEHETFEKDSILFKFKEGVPLKAGLTAGIHLVFQVPPWS